MTRAGQVLDAGERVAFGGAAAAVVARLTVTPTRSRVVRVSVPLPPLMSSAPRRPDDVVAAEAVDVVVAAEAEDVSAPLVTPSTVDRLGIVGSEHVAIVDPSWSEPSCSPRPSRGALTRHGNAVRLLRTVRLASTHPVVARRHRVVHAKVMIAVEHWRGVSAAQATRCDTAAMLRESRIGVWPRRMNRSVTETRDAWSTH